MFSIPYNFEAGNQMVMRLSKHRIRKERRYLIPSHQPSPRLLLMDYPHDLWRSFELRAAELGISMQEFLAREEIIDRVRAAQLASLDPAMAVSGGQTSKPSPQRIERIFSRLKQ
jgi:hypothetical protein